MLQKAEPKVRRMEYRLTRGVMPVVATLKTSAFPAKDVAAEAPPAVSEQEALLAARIQELERQQAEREEMFAHRLAAAQKEAFERGAAEMEAKRITLLEAMESSLRAGLAGFVSARDSYLAQVEQEVVRLALGIATRVLHREAQMDPLLLTGAVRVALGQLSDTTEVRLRIPAEQYAMWEEMVRLMPNLPIRPQLIADDTLAAGACTLETHLGSVDLGVKAQLAEIERGFFDLLDRREPMRREDGITKIEPKEG